MPKKGYNHSGRKVWNGTLKKTEPRPRYAKAVKKRYRVTAVASNDGTLGPHQMVMGQRYTIGIKSANVDKALDDLAKAGFIVEDVVSTREWRNLAQATKQSKYRDAVEVRSYWAVRAKHDQSKARHKLFIRQPWYCVPNALETLSQHSHAVAKMAEQVMARLGGLVDQRLLEEKGIISAQA